MSHGPTPFNLPAIVISIMGTAVFWGIYGPLLQKGHMEMQSGRLRPFICVGIAYVLIAIVGPIVVMMTTGMEMKEGEGLIHGWTFWGIFWSLVAGTAGALGALGMIMAFNFGGTPNYVPPLIFGFAPVVNTFFAMYLNPSLWNKMTPIRGSFFGAGLILVAVGAVTVLIAAPKGGPPKKESVPVEPKDETAARLPLEGTSRPEDDAKV
jgi:hypothetical protein